MTEESKLPKRKSTRLKNYDYSLAGAYFVTVCTRDRMPLLSEIIRTTQKTCSESPDYAVGEGLAPPASYEYSTKLKPCGEIVKEQLRQIEIRFPGVTVEDYIIMPDHIHAIIFLHESTEGAGQGCALPHPDGVLSDNSGGASPSPTGKKKATLNDVICAFKSLTSRGCKESFGIERIFQRSYAEHIIRDGADYATRRAYIYDNPLRWYYKYLK